MGKTNIALKRIIIHTIPVFIGYSFLGFAFGVLMTSQGYSLIWPIAMSILIYAGSMQFITVSLLASAFNPLYALLLTIVINARHLFYGVSMLQKYKGTGKIKPYLIFGLTDETFSILCSLEFQNINEKKHFLFYTTLLNHIYWIFGTVTGAVIGSEISFNTKGIEFVMTALFVVIFIEQWKSQKKHTAAIIGIACSVFSLVMLGRDNFIIPAMVLMIIFNFLLNDKNKAVKQ